MLQFDVSAQQFFSAVLFKDIIPERLLTLLSIIAVRESWQLFLGGDWLLDRRGLDKHRIAIAVRLEGILLLGGLLDHLEGLAGDLGLLASWLLNHLPVVSLLRERLLLDVVLDDWRLLLLFAVAVKELLFWLSRLHRLLSDRLG